MGRRLPSWVRLPWGVYHVRWVRLLSDMGLTACAVVLLLSALGVPSASRSQAPLPAVSAPPASRVPFSEPEPLTVLFGLDRATSTRFVLLSTLLGPKPMATMALDGEVFTVVPGDTVAGAVVDSIGRRTVILIRGDEVIRADL